MIRQQTVYLIRGITRGLGKISQPKICKGIHYNFSMIGENDANGGNEGMGRRCLDIVGKVLVDLIVS